MTTLHSPNVTPIPIAEMSSLTFDYMRPPYQQDTGGGVYMLKRQGLRFGGVEG